MNAKGGSCIRAVVSVELRAASWRAILQVVGMSAEMGAKDRNTVVNNLIAAVICALDYHSFGTPRVARIDGERE